MGSIEHPELPSYVRPDLWLDENNVLEFVHWIPEEQPYMALWWHKRADSKPGWCAGSFAWRRPAALDDTSFGALWELVSFDPLTVKPSLLCMDCGAHGFIEDSKWRAV